MELKLIAIFLIVLAVVKSENEPRSRPGVCPAPKLIFNCERLKKCKDDFDCVRYQKCCRSSCGPVCTDIRNRKSSAIEKTQKKGCPTPLWYGTCVRQCVRDRDCDCSERCCFNGCGYQCVKKASVVCKYGQHPKATCTDVTTNDCPKGYSCVLQTDTYEASGVCCKNPPIKPDCSLVRCAYPMCKGAYLKEGDCCLTCPDCKMVVCPLLRCKNKFIPPGQCCPVCGPDCSRILCPKPFCRDAVVPKGQCCPQCKDCSKPVCPAVTCNNPVLPPNECCPVCKPDCSAVLCIAVYCPGSFVPEGECCPRCPDKCTYKGKTYNVGQSFPDDCNTCFCQPGGDVTCTEIFCAPCEYDGVTYDSGTVFRDKCNTCNCSSGQVSCTEMACGDYCKNGLKPVPDKCGGIAGFQCPKGTKCDYSLVPPNVSDGMGLCCKEFVCPNGREPFSKPYCGRGLSCPKGFTCEYPEGEKSLYGFCCIDCTFVKCGKPECDNPIRLETDCCFRCPGPCVVNGVTYPSGTSFMNQCNQCTCSNGNAACTKIGCLGCDSGLPALENPKCTKNSDCPAGYGCEFPTSPILVLPIQLTSKKSGFCCRSPVCPRKGQVALTFTHCNNVLKCPVGFTCEEQSGGKKSFGFCCPDKTVCIVDGIVYQPGQGYYKECNKCTCTEGGLSICTLKGCPKGCYEKGTYLGPEGKIPNEDPCLDCVCVKINGRFVVRCARIICPPLSCDQPVFKKGECCGICPAKGTCVVGDQVYQPGESYFIECNGCTCSSNGNGLSLCTRIACEPGCYEKGMLIAREGESVPNDDPCLDCECSNLNGRFVVDCVMKECPRLPCTEPIFDKDKCCGRCPKPCDVDGVLYKSGESFYIECNRCRCFDGVPGCTKIGCPVGGCYLNGTFYDIGQYVKSPRPCGRCRCVEEENKEGVVSLEVRCQGCCIEKDRFYNIGDDVKRVNPCEFCSCFGGPDHPEVICAIADCPMIYCNRPIYLVDACCPVCEDQGCFDEDGTFYGIGEPVPTGNPCDICFCNEDSRITCNLVECAAPPCKNPDRDPDQCCPICREPDLELMKMMPEK